MTSELTVYEPSPQPLGRGEASSGTMSITQFKAKYISIVHQSEYSVPEVQAVVNKRRESRELGATHSVWLHLITSGLPFM